MRFTGLLVLRTEDYPGDGAGEWLPPGRPALVVGQSPYGIDGGQVVRLRDKKAFAEHPITELAKALEGLRPSPPTLQFPENRRQLLGYRHSILA
jgi:hypothetical protein